MTILVIGALVWIASALFRASKDAKRQREVDRIKREQAKRATEAARLREEWRRAQAEAKAEHSYMIALEREQMRLRREQERQAREQARQAEQLAKHEARIAKLENDITLAEREIAHYQPIVDELRREAEGLEYKVQYFENRGLPCSGYRTELTRVNEKLYRAETKVIKAQFAKQAAENKLLA